MEYENKLENYSTVFYTFFRVIYCYFRARIVFKLNFNGMSRWQSSIVIGGELFQKTNIYLFTFYFILHFTLQYFFKHFVCAFCEKIN